MNCERHFCTLSGWANQLVIFTLLSFLSLPFSVNSQNCNREIFRTINGSCNNIEANQQTFGQANQPFLREIPASYSSEDIFNGIAYPNRPNPRAISNAIFNQREDTGNAANLSSMVFTWAQFLDHDITQTNASRLESAPIGLPSNEPAFTLPIDFHRSAISAGTGIFNPRNQDNLLTAWVDGSQIYGSDQHRADWLRTFVNGKLKTSTGNLLPFNTLNGEKNGVNDPNAPEMDNLDMGQVPHFVAGDVRASEQPGLTTLHTVFVREHNRICDELIANGFLEDELIYQTARKQVGALLQAITYEQFLPALGIELTNYQGYDNQQSPEIMNLFATAAYRLGHTMVTSELLLLNDDCSEARSPLSLEQAFFNSNWIEQYDIDPIMKGLATQQQEEIDAKVIDGLRNFLFAIPQLPGTFGMDLAAINIQRGRDHGLPDYKTARQYFLNQNITDFSQINSDSVIAQQLATVFNNDINSVDLWVGLLAEEHLPNSNVGATMHEMLKEQFERLRDADFYYFENDPSFTFSEIQTIRNTSLSDIIKRNTNLNDLAQDVFFSTPCTPVLANCDAIEINALDGQIEITNLTATFSTVKVFDKNAGWSIVANCTGNECGSTQIFDLPTGDYFVQISLYENIWSDLICRKEVNISVAGSTTFSCDNIDLQATTDGLQINGLTAPFSTVKIFDKNAGWAVVASCNGGDCDAITNFNLPNGDYHIQINAYQDTWRNLICSRSEDVSTGSTDNPACEDIIVANNNGELSVAGLTAPFCTVKVFDVDNGWGIAASCAGTECEENALFIMPDGNYNVEVTMYQGTWQGQICQQFFPIEMEQSATNRNSQILQATVFPNPAQEELNLDLSKYAGKSADLQLINQYGQVMTNLDQLLLTNDLVKIPVSTFSNGWYYLKMRVENSAPVTKKIMISRLY